MPQADSSRSASPPAPRSVPRSPTDTRSTLPELRSFLLHLASERGLADNSLHAYRRDFEAALDQCDHTIELNPHFSPAYWALGMIQEQRKDFDEAVAAFQRAIDLSPHSPRMHAGLGRAMALAGKKPLAVSSLRKLEAIATQRYVSPIEFAAVRLALGQREVGFTWLDKACEDRAFDVLALRVDPRFDSEKHDPRMQAILRVVGLA